MAEDPKYLDAVEIVRALRRAGHEAYLAGGCVRDRLLGREPSDYDVATSAPPDAVRRLFPRTAAVGEAFGVVLVIVRSAPFEVATFRVDGPYKDGRRPESVTFTPSARGDVERRDFTLNALLWDPERSEVVDHVGGRADIERKVVRAVGDPRARFAEDRLRMLRAVRFACRFGFTIEPATLAAVRERAPEIGMVSAERIRDEWEAMLTGPDAGRALDLLEETGLLRATLPEVAALRGVAQPPDVHPEGDVLAHTRLLLSKLPPDPAPALAWGALLHDIGKPATLARSGEGRISFHGHEEVGARMADAIAERLRFSRADRERVVGLVEGHMKFFAAPAMRAATLKRFLAGSGFAELLELHRLDVLASNGDLRTWEFCREALARLGEAGIRPAPLLRGEDVLQLGVPRGPRVGEILRAVEEAQLEGTVTTREEAEALARRLAAG